MSRHAVSVSSRAPAARRSASLALLAGLACWSPAPGYAQEPKHERGAAAGTKITAPIRDHARLFGADAVAAAAKELERIERDTGVAAIIETTETLLGKSIDEAAVHAARQSGIEGIFILIARKETKIEVLASRKFLGALPRSRRDTIREAFTEAFRSREFDDGLKRGVAALAEVLAAADRAGELPRSTAGHAGGALAIWTGVKTEADSALVLRNQIRLTLAGARAILAGAETRARAMRVNVNIAVVDEGGHLLAFERMDGARPASGYTAITKATTAATMRQPTGPLPAGTPSPDPLLNLSLQNAAGASGGKITTLKGGVPLVVDGQVAGGVGVGGGTGEQDAEIAQSGIQSLTSQLEKAPQTSKPAPIAEKPF